jgi:hypothetical protein
VPPRRPRRARAPVSIVGQHALDAREALAPGARIEHESHGLAEAGMAADHLVQRGPPAVLADELLLHLGEAIGQGAAVGGSCSAWDSARARPVSV